jgi:hypothetical protein
MVFNRVTGIWKRLQSHFQHRGATLILCSGTLVLGMGALAWLSNDQSGALKASSPSLLDLLDEVGSEAKRERKKSEQTRQPQPPRAISWSSPLAKQCSGFDSKVTNRLQAQQRTLKQRRVSVATDPTNFGERFRVNPWGVALNPDPRVVVLHETVYSLQSAVNTFMTPHPRDADQVSYHTVIGLDGKIVDLVDPLKRAYGAGYSAFLGEWAVTNAKIRGSVNNFALHLSLETPQDGRNSRSSHSGYSSAQYDSLALVVKDWIDRFGFTPAAITTHRHVDLGGERGDPRSFDWQELQTRLAALKALCP